MNSSFSAQPPISHSLIGRCLTSLVVTFRTSKMVKEPMEWDLTAWEDYRRNEATMVHPMRPSRPAPRPQAAARGGSNAGRDSRELLCGVLELAVFGVALIWMIVSPTLLILRFLATAGLMIAAIVGWNDGSEDEGLDRRIHQLPNAGDAGARTWERKGPRRPV